MPRPDRIPRSPIRAQRFRYRANPLWPHERSNGAQGPMIFDAISGALIPEAVAVEGPYGMVDGRNGAVLDIGNEQHEAAITMRGPQVAPPSNLGRSGPGTHN